MKEIWKDIKNYKGYQVSNLGRVRTYNKITYTKKHGERHWKNRILKYKPYTSPNQKSKQGMGYRVDLWKNGKPKTLLVARLVAETFLGKPKNDKMTVNHKDGNRLNNNIKNLEWITRKENIIYGFENNQYENVCKRVKLKKCITNEVLEFYSRSKASRFLGRANNYVSNKIRKNQNILYDTNYNKYIILV